MVLALVMSSLIINVFTVEGDISFEQVGRETGMDR